MPNKSNKILLDDDLYGEEDERIEKEGFSTFCHEEEELEIQNAKSLRSAHLKFLRLMMKNLVCFN